MNIPENVLNPVSLGLVLDNRGIWVPIAQIKVVESNFLKHLEAGEVLHEGKWISMEKCFALRSKTSGIAQGNIENAHAPDAERISTKKGIPWVVVSCDTGEQHLAPDNLLSLIHQSGVFDDELDGNPDPWESAGRLPLKTIALAAGGIVGLSVVIFVIIKVVF
jgi:hypothetical protein